MSAARRAAVACAWSGWAFCVLFGIGFVLFAHFLPPPSPNMTAAEVSRMYADGRFGIRAGAVIVFVANGFYLTWTATISYLMWQTGHRLWCFVQLLGGGIGSMGPFVAAMLWIAAAFREGQDPGTTQALNDVAWLFTIAYFVPVLFQFVSVGIVGLTSTPDRTPWPRWAGYLSLWFATMAVPAALIPFFKTGPFAWDGAFGFWIPAAAFFGFFTVMTPIFARSAARFTPDRREEQARV
ncbi:MAG TPA: hypothetical protein VL595_20700 [Pseudonocardia sp.]|jgi:hypothetical protein|nr:hypothetical protein [Pseudonocardia sp.]